MDNIKNSFGIKSDYFNDSLGNNIIISLTHTIISILRYAKHAAVPEIKREAG